MKLTRTNNDGCYRGKAYYVIECASVEEAKRVEHYMSVHGWESLSDGLDSNEVGFFVESGKYGDEKDFKATYKAAKYA